MSILTKQEREGIRRRYQAESIADAAVIRALLDTIDALEAERDQWRSRANDLSARFDCVSYELMGEIEDAGETSRDLAQIRAFALDHSTTRVIGGAHAALREIAEMAGGGE